MSSIHFTGTLDNSQIYSEIAKANRSVGDWAKNVQTTGAQVDQNFSRMGSAVSRFVSLYAGAQLGNQIIKVRGEFQQLAVAFETMLGSKSKADKLMADVVEFAAKTPFQLTDVSGGTKQLLAYGVAAEDILPTLKSLGDVSAGLSVPIERLILNYGQVKTQMQLTGRELRDFNVAGVPIIAELSKNLKKSETEIQDMVSAGKIGFKDVEAAFRSMTEEGGRFANLMDKQSATITGQISNLKDNIDKMFNSIGESNEGIINSGISGISNLVENYETVLDILEGLIITYGAYKAAVIAVSVVEKVQAAQTVVTKSAILNSMGQQIVMTERLTAAQVLQARAQSALNKTMLANPYVLAAAAIAALGYGIYKLATYQTEAEKAVQSFNEELTKEQATVDSVFATLKASVEGTERYKTAKESILRMYDEYIPEQYKELKNLQDIEEAQKKVNEATREGIALKTQDDSIKQIRDKYADPIADFRTKIYERIERKSGIDQAVKSSYDIDDIIKKFKESPQDFDESGEIDKFLKKYGSTQNAYGNISSILYLLRKEADEIKSIQNVTNAHITEGTKRAEEAKKIRIEAIDNEIKALSKQQQALQGNAEEWEKIQVKIDALNKEKGIETTVKNEKYWKEQVDGIQSEIKALDTTSTDFEKKKFELQKKLNEYQSELNRFSTKDGKEIDFDPESIKASLEKIKALEAKLGTGTIEQDLELTLQITNEQEFIDSYYKRLREMMSGPFEMAVASLQQEIAVSEANMTSDNIPETLAKVKELKAQLDKLIKPAPGKTILLPVKEVEATLGVMKKLTAEEIEQLKIQGKKIENQERYSELATETAKILADSSDILGALSYTIGQVDSELGQSIGKMADLAYNASNLAINLAAGGNPITAITSGIAMLGNIFSMFKSGESETDKTQETLERINRSIERQSALLADANDSNYWELMARQVEDYDEKIQNLTGTVKNQVSGYSKDIYNQYQSQYDNYLFDLEQTARQNAIKMFGFSNTYEIDEYVNHALRAADSFNQWLAYNKPSILPADMWDFDTIYEEWSKGNLILTEEAENTLRDIVEAERAKADLLNEQYQQLLGFSRDNIAESISGGIIDGLKLSKDGLGDYAESFGDLMRKYGQKSLEDFLNEKYLQDIYKKAYEFAQSNGIDENEFEVLKQLYADSITAGQAYFESFEKLLNPDGAAAPAAMEGRMTSASEESVSLLYGQITATRVDLKSILANSNEFTTAGIDYMMESIKHQAETAANTRHLKAINDKLDGLQELKTISGKL